VKYFLDTEFIESGPSLPLILLSIGIVAEDGREFYVVNGDAPLELANDWVKTNVVPHLGEPRVPIIKIGPGVIHWLSDPKPEFWGYYADYDWVVFCQLFGTMMDLPKGWPMYCRDIKQLCDSMGNPKLPKQSTAEHNALNDARWNKKTYEFLARLAKETEKPQ
jgi:3'-5' exoribonuclease-like protein